MGLLTKYILIFIMSYAFVYFRTLNMKAIVSDRVIAATVWQVCISVIWLFSMYLGISSLINEEWIVFIPYALGGAIGNIAAMRGKHIRNKYGNK